MENGMGAAGGRDAVVNGLEMLTRNCSNLWQKLLRQKCHMQLCPKSGSCSEHSQHHGNIY